MIYDENPTPGIRALLVEVEERLMDMYDPMEDVMVTVQYLKEHPDSHPHWQKLAEYIFQVFSGATAIQRIKLPVETWKILREPTGTLIPDDDTEDIFNDGRDN